MVVSNETKCNACALHMSNFTTMQTKYATLLDECDELRSDLACWMYVRLVLVCRLI
jgi:hypothetical protein